MKQSIALGTIGACPVCGLSGWVKVFTERQVARMRKAGNLNTGTGITRHDTSTQDGFILTVGRTCKF